MEISPMIDRMMCEFAADEGELDSWRRSVLAADAEEVLRAIEADYDADVREIMADALGWET